jgi:hypothetical protein
MDARLRLTDEERDGQPRAATVERARALFVESGAVVIDNLLPRPFVERLARAYFERYSGVEPAHVESRQYLTGARRVIHPVRIAAPFDDPLLYGNPFVLRFLDALLQDEWVALSSFSAVVALPGAPPQNMHRDSPWLFGPVQLSIQVPTFALTLGVPLVDLTPETGTTAVYERSHRKLSPAEQPPDEGPSQPFIEMGGAYLMDYRVVHGGTLNPGPRARPILYLVYARHWWIDPANFLNNNIAALVIDEETLARVPPRFQQLLVRARTPLFTR